VRAIVDTGIAADATVSLINAIAGKGYFVADVGTTSPLRLP